MSEQVFSGTLDLAGLQALIDACRQQARFSILERIDAIDFPPLQKEPINVAEWPKGRLFDEAFELRWEQIGAAYRVILAGTGDSPAPADGLSEHPLPVVTDELQAYYCWEETNARLGRTLDYRCVPGQGNVKLFVREFRDDHGRLVFWRYVKMERDGGGQ
ncbi:MAG: hypothetical protein NUW24_11010 [Anaerolineae bacterium]|jgi:hypothetical protein|nr:hypothetical protein [Anaerolineae bacterium]MDH7475139.1 hypothetical protein [Anaerolineae bacterium]